MPPNKTSQADPRQILKDWLRVLIGTTGQQIVGTARALAVPLLVSPAQYGLWRLLLLIWQYGMYLHCGSFSYLNRELPTLCQNGALREAAKLRQVAMSGALTATCVACIGLLTWSALAGGVAGEHAWAIRVTAFGIVLQTCVVYQATILRSLSYFGPMAGSALAGGVVTLGLTLLTAPLWGVLGLALSMVAGQLSTTVYGYRWVKFEAFRFARSEFARLARSGGSLTVLPLITTLTASVGQVITASGLGLEQAGQYGIGLMVGGTIVTIPRTLSVVLYPRYLTAFAGKDGAGSVGRILRRSFAITSLATPTMVAIGIVLVEPLFLYVYPAYIEGLPAVRLLLVASAFEAIGAGVQNAAFALRKHRMLMYQRGAGLLASVLLGWLGCALYKNTIGVALGALVAQLGVNAVSVFSILACTAGSTGGVRREFLEAFLPTVLATSAAMGAISIGQASGSPAHGVAVIGCRLGFVAAVGALVIKRAWPAVGCFGEKKTEVA